MFAKNLRYLRKKRRWCQEELAKQLGYKSYTTIQKWESGVSEPSLTKVKEIASLFNTDIEHLICCDLEAAEMNSGSISNSAQSKRLTTDEISALRDMFFDTSSDLSSYLKIQLSTLFYPLCLDQGETRAVVDLFMDPSCPLNKVLKSFLFPLFLGLVKEGFISPEIAWSKLDSTTQDTEETGASCDAPVGENV